MMLLIISKALIRDFLIYKSQISGLDRDFVDLCDSDDGLLTIISLKSADLPEV